ncbi:enolase C-terminal domain-like protein, partial [Planctomycetota bacterium]
MLKLTTNIIPDPLGHNPALKLKGDWVFVTVSDGNLTGMGEGSHSTDDAECVKAVHDSFDSYFAHIDLAVEPLQVLEKEFQLQSLDLYKATAVSALNQAFYELIAKKERVPVWKLFADKPVNEKIPLYLTINRALTTRDEEDYKNVVAEALEQGFTHIKCAPFEKVVKEEGQAEQAEEGLSILRMLVKEFPKLSLRIDFHKRFTYEGFIDILPEIEKISPVWIEEPVRDMEKNRDIREKTDIPLAAGELYFGTGPFEELAINGYADTVMPDVKHVGGFGPLVDVCTCMGTLGIKVSPHNPAGPISTIASVHAAAVSRSVTSLETAHFREETTHYYKEYLTDG